MKSRRETEVFGLSFMDSICCGFGAILLLYILLIGKPDQEVSEKINSLSEGQAKLEDLRTEESRLEEIIEMMDSSALENRKLSELEERKKALLKKVSEQQADLLEKEKVIEDQLAQRKIEERLGSAQKTVLGLREDLTHVAFIVDTSGSMRDPLSRRIKRSILNKIENVLNTYPAISAIQFLDTSGNYILPKTDRQWLSDQTNVRRQALRTLFQYPIYSISNPYPGIERAILDLSTKTLDKEKQMGIILFGDEFNRVTPATLIKLDKLNPWRIKNEERVVSINAFGFPTVLSFNKRQSSTAFRFASLMQQVTSAHNGTLVLLRE